MDESSVTSLNLDQTDEDFLVQEVPDEILEAAAGIFSVYRMTMGGISSTTLDCCVY
jgi:hypothetical protein